MSDRCALCGRVAPLTFHHLIPRKVHRRPRFRKHYDRETLAAGVDVCHLCHRAIHRFHDEMTLATRLNTLEALKDDPALARHAAWAAKQTVALPDPRNAR
jgi:predicted restriction endonuclease